MTVGFVGIFDVLRRTQRGSLRRRCSRCSRRSFYGCQLGRGGQFHGDHREGADIVGMADWVREKGQKSTLYELNTLGRFHPLSLSFCLMTPCVVSSTPSLFVTWQNGLNWGHQSCNDMHISQTSSLFPGKALFGQPG